MVNIVRWDKCFVYVTGTPFNYVLQSINAHGRGKKGEKTRR